MLGWAAMLGKQRFLAEASTSAALDLTRDYGIECEIARSYRFLREAIIVKAFFCADLFLLLGLG
jgi:hypothetical protein